MQATHPKMLNNPLAETNPSDPIRILYVITSTDFGGTEKILKQLILNLDRDVFEPSLCSLLPFGRIVDDISRSGVRVTTLNMIESVNLFELLKGARKIARLIEEWEIDLVHSFLYRGNVIARLAKKFSKRRVVQLSGHHSVEAPPGAWKSTLAEQMTQRFSDRVVAVSHAVKRALEDRDRVPSGKISVIHNGIEIPEVMPVRLKNGELRRRFQISQDSILVGSLGRMAPVKGFKFLLEAVAGARQQGLPLYLLLAGTGPELNELKQQAETLGIGEEVKFLGLLENPALLYQEIEIFVLSSLQEAFPVVVLEAMSSGCPIIATKVGGVSEILRNNETALLVHPGSVGDLTSALTNVVGDAALRDRLASSAFRDVQNRFALSNMIENHQRLYKDLCI